MRVIYLLLFRAAGWQVSGNFPRNLRKFIIAVAPHTSNWDFPVGLAARSILKLKDARFLAKSQLFKPPLGWIFRSLGGYPVERSTSHDMVNYVANLFKSHDDFILAIAPEGTRKKVEKLKTGFYYIARNANVPIVPCGFDYRRKKIVVGDPLLPSGNIAADFEILYSFYSSVTGKNPELGVTMPAQKQS
jgi:1-acyl-sn-glycerol-3-phosphate acyltransferase